MLNKVQDVESKLSPLTLTKLDLLSFLEDITTEFKLLKHKLQPPYLGHKFSITTPPPVIAVMIKSQIWCPLMKVNHPRTMTMCQYHLDHTYHQKLSTKNLLKTKKLSKVQTFIYKLFKYYSIPIIQYLHITYIYIYVVILNYLLVQLFDVRFINDYVNYGITDISNLVLLLIH